MKKLISILLLIISSTAFCQPGPNVLAEYKKTKRIGNFMTHWYFDLVGTSLIWEERLILYSDSTYRYVYHGGECGTFDRDISGNWEMSENIIKLNDEQQYRIVHGKLYCRETPEINNQTWVMKKVK